MAPFAPNEQLSLSDARGTVLGTVAVEEVCGDAILGAFAPGPGFGAFAELFRQFDEYVEAGALAILPSIESEIAALGLCVSRAGEAPVPADVVQIYSDGGFSCRPRAFATSYGSAKRGVSDPAVAEVLFREWDPIGVNDNEQCRDEYDNYVPGIVALLLEGAGEYKLASRLSEFARVSMGLSHTDDELHRRIARRLLALVAEQ